MITNELRRRVNQSFGDDAELCNQIFRALEADKSLLFLGQDLRRETWELAELKNIQEAYRKECGSLEEANT